MARFEKLDLVPPKSVNKLANHMQKAKALGPPPPNAASGASPWGVSKEEFCSLIVAKHEKKLHQKRKQENPRF